ncbi:hypothetical protein [Nocardia otitidiscaviarum]|uniref:hypothetical protein n=1 Tax=Nocardia otitidiscaviarum TaxID=1823 RepID=UPI0018945B23|nr:hypothetical protein [Nocardia otitidiscaviarum]MBF6181098.1 hypothetical protein [Nocardia otitidiscaviarum]
MHKKSAVLVLLGTAGIATVIGNGTASALTVDPQPGAASVTLNQGEAAAVASMNLGPALAQVALPGWSPAGKNEVGNTISSDAAVAGSMPGGWMRITLHGPIQMPTQVSVSRPATEAEMQQQAGS